MRIAVVTLFPELFASFLQTSLVGRALTEGQLTVHLEALRNHGLGKHLSIDDTPYGGGSGMVMRVDCVVAAIEAAAAALGGSNATRVLLTPQGRRLGQSMVRHWSKSDALMLICGRYEGFDERVRSYVDEEASLGDFVLTGGEVAAMAAIEAVVRLLPNVLGNQDSAREESFSPEWDGILEYPQYTRPASFRGRGVPELLKSGDHKKIATWRREQALKRTRERRPDLLTPADPEDSDR
jgi:tRNA (guanine37-N1)-methyltransferase